MQMLGRRRVLLIGVGTFLPPLLVGELHQQPYDDLPFAHDRVEELADVFGKYERGGFEVEKLLDPDEDQINQSIRALFRDTSVSARIVHVISHGDHDRTQPDRLDMVPSCLTSGPTTNVGNWISSAQKQAVYTLFLVDLCGAGRVANPPNIGSLSDEEVRSWVVTASRSDEDALGGNFSLVAAEILRECAENGLGTDSTNEFVRFDLLTRRIADAMKDQHGAVQQVRWTKAEDHARLQLPFLPNPLWRDDPFAREAAKLEPPLRPFLDDAVADPEHFQRHAGLHFTGRRAELAKLVPWLDGHREGNLRFVTGTAGAGKSALIGALVCAMHPDLIHIAPHVRDALSEVPRENPDLAAVHARHRSLDELVHSIAVQLRLSIADLTAARLIEQITTLGRAPVVVVDALDECPQFSAVQSVLLLPLIHSRRPDGSAAARLLVGGRPWQEFHTLLDTARELDGLVDLDQTAPEELERDLRDFMFALLGPSALELADGVGAILAADFRTRRHAPAEERWGQFLVAGRYAEYLRRRPEATARELLSNVPTDLPSVLELELSDHDNRQAIRATLAALAFAKGNGMPSEIVQTVATIFGGGERTLHSDATRLYLRISTESDGTSLYRLYHEGLADHLRRRPMTPHRTETATGRVYEALLATRHDGEGQMSWHHAPPYLIRHAIQHAVDASKVDELLMDTEFLVHADPTTLIVNLDAASSPGARTAAAVYRTSYHQFRNDMTWRRRLLELNARRYGAADLADGWGRENGQ